MMVISFIFTLVAFTVLGILPLALMFELIINWSDVKDKQEAQLKSLYIAQSCMIIGFFLLSLWIGFVANPSHGVSIALMLKRWGIYLAIGVVAAIINWWLRGREHVRMVKEGEIKTEEAVEAMDPEKQLLFIVSGLLFWPFKLITRFVKGGFRIIMIIKNEPLNMNWARRLNPLLWIFKKTGISETEKVSLKLKE